MMIYLQRNRQPKKKTFLTTLVITVLIIAIIWSIQRFAGGFVSTVAMKTGAPFSSSYFVIKNNINFAGSFIRSRTALVEENKKLRSDIQSNEAKMIRFDALLHEYNTLLAEFGRSVSPGKMKLGNVIAKPPQSPYDVLVADIGSDQGISVGARVYGIGGIPLGRVVEVTSTTAKIVMFSSAGEENQVVNSRTDATMTIVGTGGGNIEADVAQDFDIVVDDTISLSQFGGAVVASAIAIDTSVTSATKKILFQIPVNIFDIRWVEIVTHENQI